MSCIGIVHTVNDTNIQIVPSKLIEKLGHLTESFSIKET